MRKLKIGLLAAVAVLLLGCAQARQRAVDSGLYPAIDLAWPGVRGDAARGGAVQAELDAFAGALQARQGTSLKVAWPGVRASAEQGIEDRQADLEIGPGVAASLTERLSNFDEAVRQLTPTMGAP